MVLEEEIDSSLGFLRYDYPEAVYSELRKLFRQALNEQQDLMAMAQKLSDPADRGAQDHARGAALRSDLEDRTPTRSRSPISTPSCPRSAWRRRPSTSFTSSMPPRISTRRSSSAGRRRWSRSASGATATRTSCSRDLETDERLLVFRYHDLILLKNQTRRPITVRGPPAGARGISAACTPGSGSCWGSRCSRTRTWSITSTRRKTSRSRNIYLELKDDEVRAGKAADAGLGASRCNSG